MTPTNATIRISAMAVSIGRARVGWQKACVAMANKNARILWAVMTRERGLRPAACQRQSRSQATGQASAVPAVRPACRPDRAAPTRRPINRSTHSESFHERRALEDALTGQTGSR